MPCDVWHQVFMSYTVPTPTLLRHMSDMSNDLQLFYLLNDYIYLVLAPTLALYSTLYSITLPLLWLPSTYSIATPTLTITYSIYSVLQTTINKSYLAMYFSSLNIDYLSSLVFRLLTATLLRPHLQLRLRQLFLTSEIWDNQSIEAQRNT